MSQLLSHVSQFVQDPAFLHAVLVVVLGFIFVPGGLVQRVLDGLGGALEAVARQHLPATEYAVVKSLAEDACRYAWQAGEAWGWTSTAKKDAAVAQLTRTVQAHGIRRFDAAALEGVVEAVWNDVKGKVHEVTPATPAAAATSPTEAALTATPVPGVTIVAPTPSSDPAPVAAQ